MEEMIEKAEEELQMLETQHPHRFQYIKRELQSFIPLLYSQQDSLHCTSSATTQASTSMKRKRVRLENEYESGRKKKMRRKRDRVDAVLDKARACLRKIHHFKNSA